MIIVIMRWGGPLSWGGRRSACLGSSWRGSDGLTPAAWRDNHNRNNNTNSNNNSKSNGKYNHNNSNDEVGVPRQPGGAWLATGWHCY